MWKKAFTLTFLFSTLILISGCFSNLSEIGSITGDSDSGGSGGDISIGQNYQITGDSYVNQSNVSINIVPDSSMTVSEVVVEADETSCEQSSSWEGYFGSKVLNLSKLNGTNTFHIRFKNSEGKTSNCKTYSVVHDSLEPEISDELAQVPPASGLGVTAGPIIGSSALSDLGSGVSKIEVRLHEFIGNKIIQDWTSINPGEGLSSLSLTPGVEYYYQIRMEDSAGNQASKKALPPWSNLGISRENMIGLFMSGLNIDMDGDGDEDILFNDDSHTYVLENIGDGKFIQIVIAPYGGTSDYTLNYGDIDMDGDIDVVNLGLVSSSTQGIMLLENLGNLQFKFIDPGTYALETISSIGIVNTDGDANYRDIVFSTTSSNIYKLNNNGTGFDAPTMFLSNYTLNFITADLDADGYDDLLYSEMLGSDLIIHWGSATGLNTTESVLSSSANSLGSLKELKVIDIDGDSDLDIIHSPTIGGDGRIVLEKNDGARSFASSTLTSLSGNSYLELGILDMDGDDRLDIIASPPTGDLDVLIQDGSGNFTKQADGSYPNVMRFSGVVADNDSEYVLYYGFSYKPLSSHIHGLSPANLNAQGSTVDFYKAYRFISIKDIDNDGNLDLVGAQYYNGSVDTRVYVQYDYQNSDEKTLVHTITAPEMILGMDVGDLDGDGDMEIVLNGGTTKSLYALRNDGTGSFTNVGDYTDGPMFKAKITDIEGDGDLDIICERGSDDYLVAYTNDGSMGLTLNVLVASDINLGQYSFIDWDGDNDIDLVTKSGSSINLYRNNAGTFAASTTLYTHDKAIASYFIADVDIAGSNRDFYIFHWNFMGTSEVSRVINNGSDSFTKTIIASNTDTSVLPKGVVVDVDGDGDSDIVEATTNTLVLWENDGSFNYTKKVLMANLRNGLLDSIEDYDGDGKLEAIIRVDSINRLNIFEFEN